MENTHSHLLEQGYAAAVLVPGTKALFRLYEKMGYSTFGYVQEFTCEAGCAPAQLEKLTVEDYAQRRRMLLPQGAILQEGATLDFLHTQAEFYAGENLLLAGAVDGELLIAQEFLGDVSVAPGILKALGVKEGCFRTPGNEKPFAMFYPLSAETVVPTYFGIALD